MNYLVSFFKKIGSVSNIVDRIAEYGGRAYLVGGTVRDFVLKREIKDIDIEVHGLSIDALQQVLSSFGFVRLVGKKFGVLRIDGYNIDWSLPRKDTKGRKPTVEIDPNMTIEKACKRRDLTMNAMALDLHTLLSFEKTFTFQNVCKTILDPYAGLKDISKRQLRFVDRELFVQDPLRFFRVMQFYARFEMEPDQELNELCRTISLVDQVTGRPVSKERIFEEIKKMCLKSKRPSLGFRWLEKIGRLKDVFPELYSLVGAAQRSDYHPEGDVFEHTMQSFDAAAQFQDYQDDSERFLIMMAVLCHDLGKPVSTDENLSARGHSKAGVPLAKQFLKRFMQDAFLIGAICKLVLYHRRPGQFVYEGAKSNAYKRLARKLYPQVTMRQLGIVSLCDLQGRNPDGSQPLVQDYIDIFDAFLKKAATCNVVHEPEKPILLGRHLVGLVEKGPKMGVLLKKAYAIQIDEGIKDIDELKKRVLKKE